ncbi:MAG: (Fe-S)-binding protein, partial [Desulfovibrionaceae bacterium]|nr:(Fe-S)-binding protein [Desulfovibrionaceae bacterium]
MADLKMLASRLMTLEDRIIGCMRCGNCQAVCPMFGATHKEGDVARGKMVLVDDLAHELFKDPEAVADKLGRCLLCGSCQAGCPSGVHIMDIFMEAREIVYNYLGLGPVKKAIFRVMLAKPKLFNLSMRIGSPASRLFFKKNKTAQGTVSSPLLKPLIGDRHLRSLPVTPLHAKVGSLNENRINGGLRVCFFPGCMGDKYYVSMAEACLKIFKHHGIAVFMSSEFACCGIPAVSSGDGEGMVDQLRKNLAILEQTRFDYLVTPCGSCTATIKEYWPKYAARISTTAAHQAEALAKQTMDITQFLVDVVGVKAVEPKADAKTVTYHDSCHLRKGLGVFKQPRALLQANPDYKLVEMKEAERCCGCGGS